MCRWPRPRRASWSWRSGLGGGRRFRLGSQSIPFVPPPPVDNSAALCHLQRIEEEEYLSLSGLVVVWSGLVGVASRRVPWDIDVAGGTGCSRWGFPLLLPPCGLAHPLALTAGPLALLAALPAPPRRP